MNRRHFLQFAALSLSSLGYSALAGAAESEPVLLSAHLGDGAQGVGRVALNTPQSAAINLPGRGHGIVPLSKGEAIVVSRRQGSWLAKINWQRGELLKLVDAEFDRHFFGHALLSPDGNTLLTTENNDESGQGVLGLYDAATLRRLGEMPTQGIGPHELLWLVPGKILAVANGGILTLPETGRAKLNRGAMSANLTLLDWPSGKALAQYELADKALSLRHLALASDGTLGVAMQAEYASVAQHSEAPLLAYLRPGASELVIAQQTPKLMGYGASIAAVGNQFLISALRGGQLARWRSDGTPLESISIERPAGIASNGQQAWISSEAGSIYGYSPASNTVKALEQYTRRQWDNHLILA
ncbi:DUF1513 domain-containing protein [Chitinibacter sp. S2-10]|uniref:DUF1513 domain-containing protein n=1 Tax=Chitinibacter sp. S2-10 TaxID=3373597 RepID=UPI003977A1F1